MGPQAFRSRARARRRGHDHAGALRLGTPVGVINKIVSASGESILNLTPLGGGAPAAGAGEAKQ